MQAHWTLLQQSKQLDVAHTDSNPNCPAACDWTTGELQYQQTANFPCVPPDMCCCALVSFLVQWLIRHVQKVQFDISHQPCMKGSGFTTHLHAVTCIALAQPGGVLQAQQRLLGHLNTVFSLRPACVTLMVHSQSS